MRTRDLMTTPVVTVTTGTSAKYAAGLLAEHGFTALPVVNDDDELVGMISEADLVRNRTPQDVRFRDTSLSPVAIPATTVGALMTSPAISLNTGDDVTELVRTMLDDHIRSMPIVDGRRVVGIVTRRDVVGAFARDDQAIARDVRHRLEIYGGCGRWTVEVEHGVVTIVDEFDNSTDRHVATLLAESVPGVVRAMATSRSAAGV